MFQPPMVRIEILSSRYSDLSQGRIPIPTILTTLHELGIRSVMVEGGARVIESFFTEDASSPERRIIDTIILTVAPIFVGEDGVGYAIKFGEEVRSRDSFPLFI